MKPRKPIKKVSSKRAKQLADYARLKRQFFKPGVHQCDVGDCPNIATDIHHTRGRTNLWLCRTEYWLAVCRTHHMMIHQNPGWARTAGLLAPVGKWLA